MEGTGKIKDDVDKQGFEMKKGIVIKSLLIGASLSISLQVELALSSVTTASRCRENFNGRVLSVTDSQTPLSKLQKVKIEFALEDESEKESQKKSIEIVKNGPDRFEVGESYQVGLNQGYLCRAERI